MSERNEPHTPGFLDSQTIFEPLHEQPMSATDLAGLVAFVLMCFSAAACVVVGAVRLIAGAL